MLPWEDGDGVWSAALCWTVLFTCRDCGSDVLQLVHTNPDEHVRCVPCEANHVRKVSHRLLQLALNDVSF
jgi:hypothetical protein